MLLMIGLRTLKEIGFNSFGINRDSLKFIVEPHTEEILKFDKTICDFDRSNLLDFYYTSAKDKFVSR